MVDPQSARGTRAASVCYVRERVSQESAGWHLRPPGDRRGLVGSHAGKVFAPPERGPVMPLGDDLGPSRRAAASQWQPDQTAHAFVALMEPANHGHAALACQRTRAVDGVVVLKRPVGWIVICRRCVRETSRARQGGARAGELVPFEMQTRVRL